MLTVTKAPNEGVVLDVISSNPPPLNSEVELIKGKRAVALGLVIETKQHTYKILVVTSEADGQQ